MQFVSGEKRHPRKAPVSATSWWKMKLRGGKQAKQMRWKVDEKSHFRGQGRPFLTFQSLRGIGRDGSGTVQNEHSEKQVGTKSNIVCVCVCICICFQMWIYFLFQKSRCILDFDSTFKVNFRILLFFTFRGFLLQGIFWQILGRFFFFFYTLSTKCYYLVVVAAIASIVFQVKRGVTLLRDKGGAY